MPYIVRPRRFPSRAVAACSALLLLAAAPAEAAEITSPVQCKEPALTQPFLYENDSNFYTLVPGETPNNFAGTGWKLSAGASIKRATLENGRSGSVLDLPSGAKAVSPSFCVTTDYPTARTVVRDVAGWGGVFYYVGYMGTNTWESPKNTGTVRGSDSQWTVSTPVNMQPENIAGWQIARVTLIGGGNTSDFQLYNLYIDPYRR